MPPVKTRPLHCIEFAILGPHIGPNPLTIPLGANKIEFNVVGKPPAVPPPVNTQITPFFGGMGLDCSFGLEVNLIGFAARQVAVKLIHSAQAPRVTALDASGAPPSPSGLPRRRRECRNCSSWEGRRPSSR